MAEKYIAETEVADLMEYVEKKTGEVKRYADETFAPKADSYAKIKVLHVNQPIGGITVQFIQDNVVKFTGVSDSNGDCNVKVLAGTYLVHPVFDSTFTTVIDTTISAPVFGEVEETVIGLKNGELIWSLFQSKVQDETIKSVVPIGNEIAVTRGNETLTFQHVAFDKMDTVDTSLVHNSVIQMKDCFEGSTIQFSAPQAIIYAYEAMPAGTYHFNLYKPNNIYYLNAGLQNKDVQFTTTVDIPQGGQLVLSTGSFNNSTEVSQLKLTSYSEKGGTTALETGIACIEGTSGTDLGNANEVANNDRVNSTDRCTYGSNYWGTSAMRQWLNSDKPRGQWWKALSNFDRKPNQADSLDGFMYQLDAELLAVIKPVKLVTNLNWFDGGGTETFEDYFFIPSQSQVYMTATLTEGKCWDYYDSQANGGFSDLTSPGTGADSNRIKERNGSAAYWWIRTPFSSYSSHEYTVRPSGAYYNAGASYRNGAVPACCIA